METNHQGRDIARVFFALWPAQGIRNALHAHALQYQKHCGGRCMRVETLHMTLLFVGAVRRERLPELMHAAGKVRSTSFDIKLAQCACWKHNRIAYAAPLQPVDALAKLVSDLRRQVGAAGFSFDEHGFKPHVTLLRNVEHLVEPQMFPAVSWPVVSFDLVESTLTERGAQYQVLATWALEA